MRRPLLPTLAAAAIALLLSACGSSSGGASAPLSAALSYFPSGTPLVVTLRTRPGNPLNARSLSKAKASNPDVSLLEAALFAKLAQTGVNYDRDVTPLFGTPITFGIGATQVGGGTPTPFLVAWRTHSAAALAHLVGDLHGVSAAGATDGAKLYTVGKVSFAVDGPLLLVSQNLTNLTTALDRHKTGAGFTSAEFARDTSGLPSSELTGAGDLRGVLDTPRAAMARKVPWVAAIDGYGVSLGGSTQTDARFSFRLNTGAHSLSAAQLPFAAGTRTPTLANSPGTPIAVSLRDPAQIWTFLQSAEHSADPAAYAKLTAKEQTAGRRAGTNIPAFLSSLTGNVQVVSDGTQTVGRLTVSSAAAASFEKLLAHPSGGSTAISLGSGFYRTTQSDGTTLTAGAVGDTLLLGKATVAQEKAFAAVESTPGHGSGAITFSVSLRQLLAKSIAAQGTGNPLTDQALGLIGAITGSVSVTPQALTGSASLPYHLPAQTGG